MLLTLALQTIVGLRWLVGLLTLNGLLGLVRAPCLGAHRVVVGGRRRVGGAGVAVRPHGHGGRRAPACSCAASVPAATRGAAGCTCACGRPSSSPRRPARSPSPARRGSRTTPVPSGRRSARASTCTRLPPVTGLLTVGDGASIEPEVDLAGWWLDGDEVILGRGPRGRRHRPIGARSTLLPGAHVGRDAEVEAGSAVAGASPRASGGPARRRERKGKAKAPLARRAPTASLAMGRRVRRQLASPCRACPSSRRWPASWWSASCRARHRRRSAMRPCGLSSSSRSPPPSASARSPS